MRELAVDTPDFAFKARLEQGKDGEHTFAQLSIRIGDVIFGDPDAWSLSGTIARLSQDFLERLQSQAAATPALRTFLAGLPAQALFDALEDRLYRTGGWAYEAEHPLGAIRADAFIALPDGTPIFDGDAAYLVLAPEGASRLVWRDLASKELHERMIDGAAYLRQLALFLVEFRMAADAIKRSADDPSRTG